MVVAQCGVLGSAEWNDFHLGINEEEVAKGRTVVFGPPWGPPSPFKGIIATRPNRHFLTVAPTRSGKGVSLIIPNLLLYAGSAIVIDPKGENAWITAKCRREELKQKTIILDPWDEVNRRYAQKAKEPEEVVCKFNPLADLDPKDKNYADDVAYIADALIINQGKDPHWDDSARELVAGLISFVIERRIVEKKEEKATLPVVRNLLTRPFNEIITLAEKVTRKDWGEKTRKLGFASLAARKLGRFNVENREIASIVSCALSQTAFLDSETLAENLGESDFSFSDLVNQKTTIYLVLPVDKLQTYGRWLRLMISLGIRTVARNTEEFDTPVLFILDEFGTIGRLSAVVQAYSLMAGLQMCIWAIVQDLVQLKRDYPEDWEIYISNSEYVSFFNVMDNFTTEYVSKLLGKTTIEWMSPNTIYQRTPLPVGPGNFNYSDPADKYFSRDLSQPSEVRRFPNNLGVVIGREQPIPFTKINYFDSPFFKGRARVDPYHITNISRS